MAAVISPEGENLVCFAPFQQQLFHDLGKLLARDGLGDATCRHEPSRA